MNSTHQMKPFGINTVSLPEIQHIQTELPMVFFRQYFTMKFTNKTFSIANFVCIYRQKQSVGIYQGNLRWNINNKNKTNCAMTCKFI